MQRRRRGKPVTALDVDGAAATWLLDVLAWARHGVVAPRIDLRGHRAPLPPVVLPEVEGDRLIALEPADALWRLRSRHRAFSQMAGRYSPLVVGARDRRRALHIEIWQLGEAAAHAPDLPALAAQLATYLGAAVTVHGPDPATRILAGIDWSAAPRHLLARNPAARILALQQGVARGFDGPGADG